MTSWNAKDIYCPKCGAAPGADCRDLAQGNSTNNGPHWYRHANETATTSSRLPLRRLR